ncbi:hypothetical protein B5M09_011286 [Aphanomyces astaci]|uniref:Uncharacterized protein n=1 Tax=Aphanomyces astaci TaxID=112090 RepID=A0A425D7Q6_APHAT|nr:hypothetical protein B5M09_011286 [Aphanomyces astaci]
MVIKKVNEKANAMKLFVKKVVIDMGTYTYTATIKNDMRFELAMDYVGAGISFREAAAAVQHARVRTNTPKVQGMADLIVAKSVRVLVAVGLQMIAKLIDDPSVWAFSRAGDGSTHRGKSFFDLRTRVCYRGFLIKLHLVAIPMFERHTAAKFFRLIVNFLDELYVNWRAKLLGFSSDGENTITGRHGDLVTLIVREAENDAIRFWCPPHHIDIVVKKSAECIFEGSWVNILYEFSVYLRAQNNLIIKMNVNPAKLPTADWWIVTYAISPAIDLIDFTQLQSQSLVIPQQEEHIEQLIASLNVFFSVDIVYGDHADAYVITGYVSSRLP